MPRALTARQQRFVDAYLVSRNATQAARDAGYSPERARCTGSKLLHRTPIVAALRGRGLDPPQGFHPATQLRKPIVRRRRTGINPLEERFALAYLVTGNAAEAARRAGLTVARAAIGGCKMLQRPHVAAFIEAERAASIARTRIDVDRVKRELARIAFMDIADIIEWDEEGVALKPSAQISPDDRAAIAQLKLKPGARGVKASVKFHSKQRALDSLARKRKARRECRAARAAAAHCAEWREQVGLLASRRQASASFNNRYGRACSEAVESTFLARQLFR